MESQTSRPLSPGEVVAGRYRIEQAIGEGGMGSVVAARDLRTGGAVAVKCILPVHAGNREVKTRFQREARVTSWLRSEHVARVLDSGEISCPVPAGTSARTPKLPALSYLVMERLVGQDLRSLVNEGGPLPVAEAVDYVRQACVALSEAHALGIVHRDLKPANLFRTRVAHDGAPGFRAPGCERALIKVLDFGIAKFGSPNVAGDDIEMTGPSMMIGSRPFMSPEQMLDAKEVDARADVWALGAILFYLLTGMAPFDGDSTSEVSLGILQGEPRALCELRPDVPPELEAVFRRCLEKLRDRRFANVVELSRALSVFQHDAPAALELGSRTQRLPGLVLETALSSGGAVAALAEDEIDVVLDESSSTSMTTAPSTRSRRWRGWMVAAAGLMVALTVAASAVALTEGGEGSDSSATEMVGP